MFKRIAVSTLIMGAVMAIIPAMASAEEFHDRYRRPEYRERRYERYERYERVRGYYDRFGCWHRY
jgi:hypothetical protein